MGTTLIMADYKLNLLSWKCLGPIPQQTPLNQSATLPPPIGEINSKTATPTCPTTTQAENVTTATPTVFTTEVCLGYKCVLFFAFRLEN